MSALSRAIAVRPGEGRQVLLVAGAFAAVEAGRGLGEVGVDTLVLSRSGADILPTLYVGLGLTGLVVTLGYGVALSRSSSERFFPGLLIVLALVLAAEWLIALSGFEAILPLVWISVYAAGLLLLTAIWTVGGFVFDARQAKRLFPLLTSAAIVGSLAGFLSAIAVQRIIGAESLILAEAVLFVAAAAALTGLGSRARPRRAPGADIPSLGSALGAGASYVARSPLMRLVALAYVLLAILMFSLTFPFMTAMSEAYPDESELLTVLALFSAGVTLVSFLTGTLLANRLYARLGVATVAIVLPLMYVAGFGLWIVRFSLTTAVVVRFVQQVTQRGLSNAAFSAFYNVIPSARRGQVLAFMDGVPGQVGTMLSGVLLIVASSLAMEQVFLLGLITAVSALAVLILVRRAYASSLVTTLRETRSERVLEGGPGLEALGRDGQVVAELRSATRSERSSERLLAADVLGRIGAVIALPELRALAGDDEPEIRRVAILSLTRLAGSAAQDVLRAALEDPEARVREASLAAAGELEPLPLTHDELLDLRDDPDPDVRRQLVVLCVRVGEHDAAVEITEGLLGAGPAERAAGIEALAETGSALAVAIPDGSLEDPDGGVRAAAIHALGVRPDTDLEVLVHALDDHAREVRLAAVDALRQRDDAPARLTALLHADTGLASEGALAALEGRADQVRPELLSWSETQVRRASDLRRHALSLATAQATSTAAYLGAVIGAREAGIEARLLQALGVLGAPEASGLIRRCLHAPDPEVRAQAIEALDTLGDPGLTRGVVSLLEGDVDEGAGGDAGVIVAATALSHDADRWVRALALRTLSEHLEASRRALATQVRDDPEELIRSMVEVKEEAAPMPESRPLASDIDRMLVLRHVPLFASLAPEDLQRVAAGAIEQTWEQDEVLMTEGDIGDELVVIVQGRVNVVHRRSGEPEQLVRTYEEGDHIGELAVLREAPRAATVVADAGGVRGLRISGAAVEALLRERPDAAMAMLATLAERISERG